MKLRPWALGTLACVCGGASAQAQSASLVAPAMGEGRQIHGSISVRAFYDSNASRTSSSSATTRGIEPHDYTYQPNVTLSVVQPLGRQEVFFESSAGYDFHQKNTQLNRFRGNITGGYSAALGICQASAIESYAGAQADLETIDTNIGTSNYRETYVTAASVQCGTSSGIQGGVSAQRQEAFNSAQSQRTADNTIESLAMQVGYGNATLGQLGVAYNYSSNELPNRIIPGRPIGDGFFTESYSLTASRQFGSKLVMNGSVGRTLVKREFAPPGVDSKFTSTTYSGAVSYQFGSRLHVDVSGGRSILPTQRAGKLYDITTTGQINGQYSLGSRISLAVGYRIADTKSNADNSLPVRVITSSRTYSTSGSVTYRQNKNLSLSLDVNHDDRTTNLPEFNYTATRVGLTASFAF